MIGELVGKEDLTLSSTTFRWEYPHNILEDNAPLYHVKEIAEQTSLLKGFFPRLGYANEDLAQQPRPRASEGWFTVPQWHKIEKTYPKAFLAILEALVSQLGHRNLFDLDNFIRGRWGKPYLHEHSSKVDAFQKLRVQQNEDFLVFPAQFGLRHRKIDTLQGRNIFLSNEVGLGAFEVGCMLLSHLERFTSDEEVFPSLTLGATCPGDEYTFSKPGWSQGDRSVCTPFYYFCEHINKLTISVTGIDNDCDGHCGLVTMFLPTAH
ncbi:MAG: hypothetical protein V1652_03525 [bacterium]